jgi:hypothetical protein
VTDPTPGGRSPTADDAPDLEKALDVALEVDKQVITISMAVLAISGSLIVSPEKLSFSQQLALGIAWVAFLASTIVGVLAFMNLAGILTKRSSTAAMRRRDFPAFVGVQLAAFLVGVLAFGAFGFTRVFDDPPPAVAQPPTIGATSPTP